MTIVSGKVENSLAAIEQCMDTKQLWVNIDVKNSLFDSIQQLELQLSTLTNVFLSDPINQQLAPLRGKLKTMEAMLKRLYTLLLSRLRDDIVKNRKKGIAQFFKEIEEFVDSEVPNYQLGNFHGVASFIYRFLLWAIEEELATVNYELVADVFKAAAILQNDEYIDACVRFIHDYSAHHDALNYLMNSGDLLIVCSDQYSQPVDRTILCSLGSFFEGYFLVCQSNETGSHEIVLDDVSFHQLRLALKCLYTGYIEISIDREVMRNVFDIYKFGSKYGISRIEQACVQGLITFLSDNWYRYLIIDYCPDLLEVFYLSIETGCYDVFKFFATKAMFALLSSKSNDREDMQLYKTVAQEAKDYISTFSGRRSTNPSIPSVSRLGQYFSNITQWNLEKSHNISYNAVAKIIDIWGGTMKYLSLSSANNYLNNSNYFHYFFRKNIMHNIAAECPELEELHITHSPSIPTVFKSWSVDHQIHWTASYEPPYVIHPIRRKRLSMYECQKESGVTQNFSIEDIKQLLMSCKKIRALTLCSNCHVGADLEAVIEVVSTYGKNIEAFTWYDYSRCNKDLFFQGEAILESVPQLNYLKLVKFSKIPKRIYQQDQYYIKEKGYKPIFREYILLPFQRHPNLLN